MARTPPERIPSGDQCSATGGRPRFGEGRISFRPIEELAATVGPLDSLSQDHVRDWLSLTSELQAMVPHLAQLIVRAMGRPDTWQEFSEGERNIWVYTATALLAEARRLVKGSAGPDGR